MPAEGTICIQGKEKERGFGGGNIDMSFGGKYSEIKLSANTILVHKKLKKSTQIYVFAK